MPNPLHSPEQNKHLREEWDEHIKARRELRYRTEIKTGRKFRAKDIDFWHKQTLRIFLELHPELKADTQYSISKYF